MGICLPLLLLQGLKRGHVAELRKDLMKSPVGRQIEFWSGRNAPLRNSSLAELQKQLRGVDIIIGYAEHIGAVQHKEVMVKDLSLRSTASGDPLLVSHGGDVLTKGERAIVVSKPLAEKLRVGVGDEITLLVLGRDDKHVSVGLRVKHVLQNLKEQELAYLDLTVHDWIEQFLSGYGAPELNWPSTLSIGDSYSGYLMFCEPSNDLTKEDYVALKRKNFYVEPKNEKEIRNMFGLLKTDKLKVYFLRGFDSHENPRRRLRENPEDLERITEADDVVLAWNPPQTHTVEGIPLTLIGCSLPQRCWLRSYFLNSSWPFGYDQDLRSVKLPATDSNDGTGEKVILHIRSGDAKVGIALTACRDDAGRITAILGAIGRLGHAATISDILPLLACATQQKPVNGKGERQREKSWVAIIPVNLLAHLDALKHDTERYDPVRQGFIPTPDEISYRRGRLYCQTIDEVPDVVRQLDERGYGYDSATDRIAEIHRQAGSLQTIVLTVVICVVCFGVWTISCVLFESTVRRHRTIGIMRVMGVSQMGVFYIVLARAAMIGVIAGSLAACVGWVVSVSVPSFVLDPLDIIVVFVGSVFCAVAGSLYPAWRASCVDPFDAIVEGRLK